ncbi:MAG TPA: fasciclin domain-containing protein [Cyclobacteriaceae bacterium]|nr:fasciclin domain-containing protein [Cyclobacteriaceae bacterium]
MKIWKNLMSGFLSLTMVALIVASISSCNDDEDTPKPTQSIVALAQGQTNLSFLVTALTKYPDLVALLNGSGNFTVFAPTNDAFTALLSAVGQTSIDDVPEDVLKSLLQYHVVTSGAVLSTQLTAGNVLTANTENIAVTVSGGIRLNGSTQVVTADVLATNGVVHIVDQVLVPASIGQFVNTIVEPAYFNKNFTTLIAAVKAASPSILETLLNDDKKTLFAPDNNAFTVAGISATALPARATLDAVLGYHVIGSEIRAAQLPTNTAPANSEVTTLNGKFYLSNRGTTGVFINGTTKVTATDIIADNGVVHVIDRTLMPPSQTIGGIATSLSQATTAPQFTQLVAALGRVPALLEAASSADSKLTVFAPTDAAFEALYDALEVDGINDIEIGLLTAVLQHHIVSAPTTATGKVFSTDLVNGAVPTLNGDVTISATNGTVTSSGGTVAQLSGTAALLNVLGTNGVIHTINAVLVPGD